MRVLITGSSGFIGQQILKESLKQGHDVFCLKHENINNSNEAIKNFSPEILVHCAWGGVSAADRNNKIIQEENLNFSIKILNLYKFKQIIALGSQDEYGKIDKIVKESHELKPLSEYAIAKSNFCNYLQDFSIRNKIVWQWIRIFNTYGENQSDNWLIPSIIKKCIGDENVMDTTKGEQQYAYLHVEDLGRAIVKIYGKDNSGIYNLSSAYPLHLNEIFLKIKKHTESNIKFNFGSIPYRPFQSMMICGDSSKFINTFGEFETISLDEGIQRIIKYYRCHG